MHRDALIAALQSRLEDLAAGPLEPVTVCVIDSGIDATHPAVAGRVIEAHAVRRAGDEVGVTELSLPANNDVYGHGTAVASIICDLAPNARLVDVRLLDERNRADPAAFEKSFELALRKRTRVVNMSLAAPPQMYDQLVRFCEQAYYQNQIVVASKRNLPIRDIGFPAGLSSCIGVDAQSFPNWLEFHFRKHDAIECVAMGEDIKVAQAGGGYTTKVGTSYATPVITGVCALLLGAHQDLAPYEVKTLLKAMASAHA